MKVSHVLSKILASLTGEDMAGSGGLYTLAIPMAFLLVLSFKDMYNPEGYEPSKEMPKSPRLTSFAVPSIKVMYWWVLVTHFIEI